MRAENFFWNSSIETWTLDVDELTSIGHTLALRDNRKSISAIEFATNCISVDFILNGRKVMSMIMEMTKKMKI